LHVRRTNNLRAKMGQPAIVYAYYAERHPARRDASLTMWVGVHRRTADRYAAWQAAPWLRGSWYAAAMCVHSHEGAWNDPNAPYYGGMQMDYSFQAAYGAEWLAAYGTADHWPPVDQLHAAYRAWQARGWSPWPHTSILCGL
jgi:hypothetical protein